TSDNISPRHLLNIKRLAYEVTPVVSRWDGPSARQAAAPKAALPSAPPRQPAEGGVSAEALTHRIDQFLGSRGFKTTDSTQPPATQNQAAPAAPPDSQPVAVPQGAPLDFVCEDDVRLAIQAGRKLVLAERAIVTPAARDLGEQHRVFSVAPW